MDRPADWRSHLAAHIEANRYRPFEWGEHDCALWSTSARSIARGVPDPGDPYRSTYTSAVGAVRRLIELDDVRTVVELADRLFGDRQNVAMAKAGDVVAGDLSKMGIGEEEDAGLSLGICFGALSYFAGHEGLVAIPTLNLEHCYHG